MGFESASFGLNEPTLTSAAYVFYLLSFLFYTVHLLTRAGQGVRYARGQAATAGMGGTITVAVPVQMEDSTGNARRSGMLGRLGFVFVSLAWVSLTGALALRWLEVGHPPYVTLYEIATMLVWGTTTIYIVLFELVLKARAAGAFVVLLIFCLQSYALWFIEAGLKEPVPLVPALRSYWLMIHVSMAIISYSAFATAAGAGLTYLAKHYLKGRVAASLPSGAAIEEFMFRAVAVGFPFMTLVLITGAIWAQEAWTKAWSWDPKETWALVTWLVYAAYLHVRVQRGVRGITMAWLSLVGFVVVLITFMGVNYLVQWFGLESMHTYSVDNGQPQGLGVASLVTIGFLVVLLFLALFAWLRVKFPMPGRKSRQGS
jgi:cytochrome c-type biogenesis protein CcsB